MRRRRLGLVGRLAVATTAIAVVSVGLSVGLFYDTLDGRLDRLARAHVESSASRVAAITGGLYRGEGGWSPVVLNEVHQRAHAAGFDIRLRDERGRWLVPPDYQAPPESIATAPVRSDGRYVGRLTLLQLNPDVFTIENQGLKDDIARLLELCAIALALGMIIALAVATTLVRPLRRLTQTAERMNQGDLSARAEAGGGAELEQLAGTFNRLASRLEHEDELRRAAAADIAHELRTPVTGLVSRIEAAQDGVMADDAANLAAMHAEALRLSHLIRDVGQLADAERASVLIDRAVVDLADACTGRAAAYEEFFAAKGIRFEADIRSAYLHGDARRLEQVVDNLLSNALRYTDAGGRVTLACGRDGDSCVLEVRDTGIGIADEDLARVFDRFWRSDRSRSRATGGSGIGLAVVRELVRAHHGTVELVSEPGRGTTARASLPAAVAAGEPALV